MGLIVASLVQWETGQVGSITQQTTNSDLWVGCVWNVCESMWAMFEDDIYCGNDGEWEYNTLQNTNCILINTIVMIDCKLVPFNDHMYCRCVPPLEGVGGCGHLIRVWMCD